MSEPKACNLPTLFQTRLDDRAWVQRIGCEIPNLTSRCTGLSMSNSLARSRSGNLSRSRTASTWTNPEEHGRSRGDLRALEGTSQIPGSLSSNRLSLTTSHFGGDNLAASLTTMSPPKAVERRWTPLPPDSPLLTSLRSMGSTGSLHLTEALNLDHGVSGFSA